MSMAFATSAESRTVGLMQAGVENDNEVLSTDEHELWRGFHGVGQCRKGCFDECRLAARSAFD